jgi:plastocyanin
MPMSRLLAVAALLIVVGCSGDGTGYGGNPPPAPPPPPPPPPPAPGPTLSVSVNNNNTFTPSNGSVTSGGTVTWNWAGGVTHNVTFEDGLMDSGNRSEGSHARMFPTVTNGTTFRYRCTIHSTSFTTGSMIGQIVVVP